VLLFAEVFVMVRVVILLLPATPPENAPLPIDLIPQGKSKFPVNELHPENALTPIVFIELGEEKITLVKQVHPKNAFTRMSVIPGPMFKTHDPCILLNAL